MFRKFILGVLIGSISFFCVSQTQAAKLSLSPSTGTMYYECYHPITIKLDTQGTQTVAVDAKILYEPYFRLNYNPLQPDYLSGDFDNTTRLLRGYSMIDSEPYAYLNVYQSDEFHPVQTGDTDVGTIYFKPDDVLSEGVLQFYFLPGEASDDSNVISGLNADTGFEYTKIVDNLSAVTVGMYDFEHLRSDEDCPEGTYTYYPVCGNGWLEEGEECDDGNLSNHDGCNYMCELRYEDLGNNKEPIRIKDDCDSKYSDLPGANQFGIDYSSSIYDETCEAEEQVHEAAPICMISDYSREMQDAYIFSCDMGITTQTHINDANMEGVMYRKHLAKMASEYAMKVLDMKPNPARKCRFDDVDGEDVEMQKYMKLACQLGIMGLQYDGIMPLESFEPNGKVSRAQFGTVFSRMVFRDKYNGDKKIWYRPHLNALKRYGIMNDISQPEVIEKRGFVMIMMNRFATHFAEKDISVYHGAGPLCQLGKYSRDYQDAYLFACDNKITTKEDIADADMYGNILRKHAAKMISQYALEIMKREPDISRTCDFQDMEKESDEMQLFSKIACQLGLMGVDYDGSPAENFNPNGYLTKAEIGTVISRLIFGDTYNGDKENWYVPHLNALRTFGILTDISGPLDWAVRGDVMVMLYKASSMGG